MNPTKHIGKCVLYERECIGCLECEACDLDPNKVCDNCGKCLEIDGIDIKAINIIPYADNTYFICILLKDPAKYIKNTKLLNKLNKQKRTIKWGHIRFSSLYFKKEFNNIIEIMKYYYSQYNEDLND